MPIPDYQRCMLPLLKYAADGEVRSLKEAVNALAQVFRLSEQELGELLPSGRQPVFRNRVAWARWYLKKAGLLASPRRGFAQITERGRAVLAEQPVEITTKYLDRFPEFFEFRTSGRKEDASDAPGASAEAAPLASQTPQEALESSYERLRAELAAEILQTLAKVDPSLFEWIVVQLLVKMGYGGSLKDAGQAIGRSGDAGIDGIIKEDHLGLDSVYVQAKRWEATVGRPEIQKFAGALQGQRARKGVFITTSDFSKEAHDYVSRIESKIVLLDGKALAGLMIDFGVGVTTVATYEVKKIDSDFFEED
jgi:restriction system protein